jgi:hypothetical protein
VLEANTSHRHKMYPASRQLLMQRSPLPVMSSQSSAVLHTLNVCHDSATTVAMMLRLSHFTLGTSSQYV